MDLDRIQVYWIRINADLDAHPGFFKTNIWKYLELTKYFDILL
jgi:hypothetical protein